MAKVITPKHTVRFLCNILGVLLMEPSSCSHHSLALYMIFYLEILSFSIPNINNLFDAGICLCGQGWDTFSTHSKLVKRWHNSNSFWLWDFRASARGGVLSVACEPSFFYVVQHQFKNLMFWSNPTSTSYLFISMTVFSLKKLFSLLIVRGNYNLDSGTHRWNQWCDK